VNDWGKIVADEIIEGVQKFAEAHPFVNKNRIGCIGASYRRLHDPASTDENRYLRRRGIARGNQLDHELLGRGYWGYSYKPFRRRQLPLEQARHLCRSEPAFQRDKIKTRSSSSTARRTQTSARRERANVHGLKLLGKQVEYIQVEDRTRRYGLQKEKPLVESDHGLV